MDGMTGSDSTPGERAFDISGGRLCLDFVNTVDSRPTPERVELIPDMVALLAWAEEAGALDRRAVAAQRRELRRSSQRGARAHARAIALREQLFAIFAAAVRREPVTGDSLEALNAWLPRVAARRRLGPSASSAVWRWTFAPSDFDYVSAQAAHSAAELLAAPEIARVKLCGQGRCDWLFLDDSRNRSRRWCDMATCGNRAKARRHYERVRGRNSAS